MSVIDDAISRLQAIALACTSETIKEAPDYPPEDAAILPMAVAYIASGTGQADNATDVRLLLTVNVDIHFNRISMKSAYRQINNIIPEYLERLAGDPTLDGNVDTIVFPVSFDVGPSEWDKLITQCVTFTVPLKFLEDPQTTA